jgi:IS1 family transposase
MRVTPSCPSCSLNSCTNRALLAPFGITHDYTDKAGGSQRHLPPAQHTVGKLLMQKIERKHLTLRTRLKRLARQAFCFSRSRIMHDLLIGLYMNQVEFDCAVCKRATTKLEHYRIAPRFFMVRSNR